ncbi:MAG: hypothetical protein ABSG76_09980 [Xanthobacteraceae bacterium]
MVTEVGQAILEGIARLDEGIARLDARLTQVDGRLSAMETRLSSVETRLSSVETHLSMLENRQSTIEAVVAELDHRIKTWPDMHFLAAATKAQIGHTRDIKADVSDIKSRMAEIFQTMATDPEIRSLREEVSRFRDQSVEFDVRIGTIESHLGLETTPTARRRPLFPRSREFSCRPSSSPTRPASTI